MPLAFLIIGVVLAITAFRNSYGDLAKLLVADFTGSGNFLIWVAAIVIIGAAGYVPKLQTPSRVFLALVLLAIFLANGGVWAKLQTAVQGATATPPSPNQQEPQFKQPLTINIGNGAGGKGSNPLGDISGAANAITSIGSFFA